MKDKILYLIVIIEISMQMSQLCCSEKCTYEIEDNIICNCSDTEIQTINAEDCTIFTSSTENKTKQYVANNNHITHLTANNILKLSKSTNIIIELKNNNIFQIDDDICEATDTTYKIISLDLSNNKIKHIPINMAKCIKTLILDHNKIIIPQHTLLLKSETLIALYLINCSIQNLYEETFQDLTSLSILDISNNKLKYLEQIQLPGKNISIMNEICKNTSITKIEIGTKYIIETKNNEWDCSISNIEKSNDTEQESSNSKSKEFMTYAWLYFGTVILIEILILLLFVYLYVKDKKEK